MIVFGIAYIFTRMYAFFNEKKSSLTIQIILIYLYISLVFILVSSNIIYAGFQIFWYMTMLFAFLLSKEIINRSSIEEVIGFVRVFVNINVVMHLIDVVNWRLLHNERFMDLAYGFFEIPSPFALVIGGYAIFIFIGGVKISKVEKVLLVLAILFSESRIGTGAFFITMLLFSKYKVWLFISTLLLYISVSLIDVHLKALSFLTLTYEKLLQDPSLQMRVGNMNAMVDWWNASDTMWFGGGVLSHLEYSYQFGKPGPLDSFYLKMISDFGVVSSILVVFSSIFIIIKKWHIIKINLSKISSIIVFISIYSTLNEGLVSIKSGHIIFFLIGALYYDGIKRVMRV